MLYWLIPTVYQLKNFPKLKTLIDEKTAGCANTMVTLSGDFIAPSLLSALDQGAGMIAMLNKVGVTHVCFGNHVRSGGYVNGRARSRLRVLK